MHDSIWKYPGRASFIRIALAPVIFLGILLGACESTTSPAEHLQRARQHLQEDRINEGIIELKNALQKDPENAETRWMLGKAFLEKSDGAEALAHLEKARDLGFNDPELQPAILRSLLLKREYLPVLLDTPRPDDAGASAELLAIRAEAWLGQGKVEEAKTTFARALELDSGSVPALLGSARTAVALQNYAAATAFLDRVEDIDDSNFRLWVLRGQVALLTGKLKEAEAAYTTAIPLSTFDVAGQLGLARTYMAADNYAAAEKQLRELGREYPNLVAGKILLGQLELQRGNTDKAKDILLKVLTVAPDNPQVLLMVATLNYNEGQYLQAEEQIARFLSIAGNYLPALKLAAAIDIRLGDPLDALNVLEPAYEAGSSDPQFLAILGNAHLRSGNFDAAIRHLSKAAELAPDQAGIKTQRALGKFGRGSADEAIADLEAVARLNPDMLGADVMLLLLHIQQRDWDAAIERGQRSLEEHENSPLIYNLIGAAYLGKNEIDTALEQFNAALAIDAEFTPAMVNLANVHFTQKKMEQAAEGFRKVLGVKENHVEALIGLARIAAVENRTNDYRKLLERASKAGRNAVQPRIMLANYYLRTGVMDRALAAAREARDLAPGNPVVLALLGRIQVNSGRFDAAIESFRQAVAAQPDDARAHFLLGMALMHNNELAEAKQSLQRAHELEPDNLEVYSRLVSADIRMGNADEAMAKINAIKQRYPESPRGHAIEGDINMLRGNVEAAIRAYSRALALGESSELAVKLYQARVAAGEADTAFKALSSWVERYPRDTQALGVLADRHLQAGEYRDAISEYERIRDINPANAVALNNLAWLYQQTGDPRALETARQAHEFYPQAISVVDTLAWILIENGQVESGLNLLEQAMAERDITEPEVRFHYASGLARTGEARRARRELQAILEEDTAFPGREAAEKLLERLSRQP